jgi:hypothetical protein
MHTRVAFLVLDATASSDVMALVFSKVLLLCVCIVFIPFSSDANYHILIV